MAHYPCTNATGRFRGHLTDFLQAHSERIHVVAQRYMGSNPLVPPNPLFVGTKPLTFYELFAASQAAVFSEKSAWISSQGTNIRPFSSFSTKPSASSFTTSE